jgi:hypothetical protein
MLRYEKELFNFLINRMEVIGITEVEAQGICIALEMYNTKDIYYLSEEEILTLSCISTDTKKKNLWKLIKEVQNDPQFTPVLVLPSLSYI